jgi:hypothetical protein
LGSSSFWESWLTHETLTKLRRIGLRVVSLSEDLILLVITIQHWFVLNVQGFILILFFGGDLITRNKQVQLMLNPCLFMGEIFYHFWCILLALPTTTTTTTTKAIKDIVFRFIIEYNSSSLRDFYWPILGNNNNNSSIYFYMRIKLERWYFGLCWNLRLVTRVIISWRILVSFRGFFLEDYIWVFIILLYGKAMVWYTPLFNFEKQVILGVF